MRRRYSYNAFTKILKVSLRRPGFYLPETTGGYKIVNVTPCLTDRYGLRSRHRHKRPDTKVAPVNTATVAVKTTVNRSPNRKVCTNHTKTRLN